MATRRSRPEPVQPPLMTRKHITRAERQARQRQLVVIGTAIVAVLVALILTGGALYSAFIEPSQTMARIGDETITREAFYRRVNYERFRIAQVIRETRAQADELLSDPQSAGFFYQFFAQQLGQLQAGYANVGSQILETMIEEQIIEQEAAERGITVSDEEVEEQIRREIAQLSGALIEADVTATAEAAVAATETAESFTPTPTLEPTATPTDTVVTGPITPTTTPFPTLTPAPTTTPNVLSAESLDEAYAAFLTELRQRVGYTEEDYRRLVRLSLLRDKLAETLAPTSEEQVRVAHILVETEEEAQQVVARLEAGEAFADVAAEVSTDSTASSGGELGWISRQDVVEPFAEAAFALSEPEQISDPVESQFGWHLIQLLEGPEERPLDEEQRAQREQEALQTFLLETKGDYDVQRLWNLRDLPSDPFENEGILEPLPTPVPVTPLPMPTIQVTTEAPDAVPDAEEAPAEATPAP